ncbi:MAG: hypothetical protein D6748_07950 [Calditrichaeota bacterium]|nr:MAG: hypothetical protein D6748_07950 [Calditrichota bacterium]
MDEFVTLKLNDIAEIQTGIYRIPDLYGDVIYLQAKHFTKNGVLISPEHLTRELRLTANLEKHLLKNDDILFAAKGDKNFAFRYHADMGDAVASSTFLVIRIKEEQHHKIITEYLQWLLNHPFTQSRLKAQARGSSLPHISKKELAKLLIPLPPLPKQQRILEMYDLWQREMNLSQQIIDKKQKLYQAILYNWAKGEE